MTQPFDALLPGSLYRPLPFQREHVGKLLRQKRLQPDRLTRDFKVAFDQAVISVYRGLLDASLTGAGADAREIALKLVKNKGIRSRWLTGRSSMDWETLYLAIAAFDVDVRRIGFPRGREAVIRALAANMPLVRDRLFAGRHEECTVSHETIVCLHYTGFSPQWWNAQRTRDARQLAAATDAIRHHVLRHAPAVRIGGHEDIERIIEPWGTAWIAFLNLIPYEWTFLEKTA